jgi:dihydrofolate synthase/folylpolyglutamate synthase
MVAQRAVKLERMFALLAALDHPELRFASVLVAGTKGKGSTVAMIGACLRQAGYRVGRYTSPHLLNWRERTCINAEPISTDTVIALAHPVGEAVKRIPASLGPPTTFEVGTAFAFEAFARANVDLAVVEVGTGGRFDATNLVEPRVSVIAPVSYDHTQTLGSTLTSIAWHKAGIIRVGRPAISAPQPEEARQVIHAEARRVNAHLEEVGREWWWVADGARTRIRSIHAEVKQIDVEIALRGDHQRDNATTAVAALHALAPRFDVPFEAIRTGLANVDWPGRLEVLSKHPLIVLDGAHNTASAEVLGRAIEREFAFKHLMLVVGLTEGKDATGVIGSLAPRAHAVFLTRSRHERSADPETLAVLVRSAAPHAQVNVVGDLAAALDAATRAARSDDLVLVTGSLFLVGEALLWWRRSPR